MSVSRQFAPLPVLHLMCFPFGYWLSAEADLMLPFLEIQQYLPPAALLQQWSRSAGPQSPQSCAFSTGALSVCWYSPVLLFRKLIWISENQ